MNDINDLYQEVILDHNRNPRNFRELREFTSKIEGYNPICGDHFWVYLKLKGNIIEEISFSGEGCAISKASASMMTEFLKGKTKEEAIDIFNIFHELLTKKTENQKLGKLKIFSGIWKFPARVKCASLAWHTLKASLSNGEKIVKTE